MSLFDFPRINIQGTLSLNPGTANNDDYAGSVSLPASWGPFAGETLALIDSKAVEARTYGMSDADFIAWVQKAQTFDVTGSPGKTQQVIPAEWNYYGDMGSSVIAASVVGVQTAPDKVFTAADPAVPVTSLIGAALAYDGGITDVNSQGSPPGTQFFIDQLTLKSGSTTAIQGRPSKGACQWINFYRNVNLNGDGGAGGYVYHVILKGGKDTIIDVPGFEDPKIKGVIFRYYLFRTLQGVTDRVKLQEMYAKGEQNPAALEFVATIAPLYEDEDIITGPTGRLLTANATTIPTPTGSKNNGNNGLIALAPAALRQSGNLVSADFSGTFPDNYQPPNNPKYDFGPVTLMVDGGGASVPVAQVDYADTAAGNARGWLFDFTLPPNAQTALQDPNATFRLSHPYWGNVLAETEYYFVSNQQGIYAEQHGPGNEFLNQGTVEPATAFVYSHGRRLAAGDCPPITVWQYRSIPLQSPGNAEILQTGFQPGAPLTVDTSQPGNYLITFTARGPNDPPPAGFPPQSYLTFMMPPYVTNWPSISLRILPNGEDFSHYYVDPKAEDPVGNEQLTFDVLYRKVLRTYYLLYPAMNQVFALNSETAVKPYAKAILARTEKALWMTTKYMPRTRDLSESRRKLLRAWCQK